MIVGWCLQNRAKITLVRIHQIEQNFHRNQENPDEREQAKIARRMAGLHTNIRGFYNLLNYSQDTYKKLRRTHLHLFDPLRMINLIRHEMQQISNALLLPGSLILNSEFPEDITAISGTERINSLFNTLSLLSPNINTAAQHIRAYCAELHIPLCLKINGLHGVGRGERSIINTNDIHTIFNLIQHIIDFGQRCQFYLNLARNPAIVEGCFYHLARIQKLTVVLRLSNEVNASQLPKVEEFKALRNFIHHGIDLFETMNIPPLEFMTRYASLFLNVLLPSINAIEDRIQRRQRLQRVNLNALLINGLHSPLVLNQHRGQGAVIPRRQRLRSF